MTGTLRPEYTAEQVEAAKLRLAIYADGTPEEFAENETELLTLLDDDIRTILSALSTAESEIKRLTADSKRLDFLSSDCNAVLGPTFHKATKNFGSLVRVNGAEAWGFTLREAIDAARNQEGGND